MKSIRHCTRQDALSIKIEIHVLFFPDEIVNVATHFERLNETVSTYYTPNE